MIAPIIVYLMFYIIFFMMLYFIALISNKTLYINIFIIFGIVTLIIISVCYLIIYLMEKFRKKKDTERRVADILKLAEENATNLQDVLETLPPVDDNTETQHVSDNSQENVEIQDLPSWMESYYGVSLPPMPTFEPPSTHTRPISRRPSSQTEWDNMLDNYRDNREDDIPWHSVEDATTAPTTTAPTTTRPATTRPATTIPATTIPATTRPATTRPATTRPATTKPATTRPATTVSPTENCENVSRIGQHCGTGWKCRDNTWHCDPLLRNT